MGLIEALEDAGYFFASGVIAAYALRLPSPWTTGILFAGSIIFYRVGAAPRKRR